MDKEQGILMFHCAHRRAAAAARCANASVALCSGEQPLLQHLHKAMFHSNAVPPPCSSHCCSTCIMLFVPRSRCAATLSSHLPLFQEHTSAYGHCCCALTSQLQQLQQYRTVSTPSRITPPPQPVLAATTCTPNPASPALPVALTLRAESSNSPPARPHSAIGNSATRQLGNLRLCDSATRQQRTRPSSTPVFWPYPLARRFAPGDRTPHRSQHNSMAAPALRNIATPQHRSSTTNTASAPALQAQHLHQQQQQHDQHIISTSNCTRGALVTQRQHGAEPHRLTSPALQLTDTHRRHLGANWCQCPSTPTAPTPAGSSTPPRLP